MPRKSHEVAKGRERNPGENASNWDRDPPLPGIAVADPVAPKQDGPPRGGDGVDDPQRPTG
jgi:hypothetical protein